MKLFRVTKQQGGENVVSQNPGIRLQATTGVLSGFDNTYPSNLCTIGGPAMKKQAFDKLDLMDASARSFVPTYPPYLPEPTLPYLYI